MATVGSHAVQPFPGPVNGRPAGVDANIVRSNDNLLRQAYVAHDADPTIHMQSGTLAARPVTLPDGSTYFATDTQDTYTRIGGVWVQTTWAHWYIDCYDTTDQPALAINTEQLVTLNTTGVSRGITRVSGSQLRVDYAGDYNIMFSAQLVNTDSAEHDVFFWFKKNGTNLADSAGRITVQKKHGSDDGHLIAMWNVYVTMAATDYLQLYWQSTGTTVSLETIPAAGSVPRAPSVIVTMNRI